MYSWLWFDLGYTLVKTPREENLRDVLARRGTTRDAEHIRRAFYLADKFYMRERPGELAHKSERGMAHYFERLSDTLEIDNDRAIWREFGELSHRRAESGEGWVAFSETIGALSSLSDRYKLGLISNWDLSARQVLARNALEPYLSEVIVSSEVGIEKPDRRIFELAVATARGEKCLYVGDNYYDDYVGSAQVGWDCVIVDPFNGEGIPELTGVPIIHGVGELLTQLTIDS
ncbi:MAG: HAD family hydrolase [Oscillospiraceae bacterium]|jgi:putative hydrolase of the HAD superfamily|nr:HAD family hydrolase [Oscillospiraceae bacterium]